MRAAEICLEAGLVNSAASRAYYAMFQAAQVALARVGFSRETWSHAALQATFARELINRRKLLPGTFKSDLSSGLVVRQSADYGPVGVGSKTAERLVRRATLFVGGVQRMVTYEAGSETS